MLLHFKLTWKGIDGRQKHDDNDKILWKHIWLHFRFQHNTSNRLQRSVLTANIFNSANPEHVKNTNRILFLNRNIVKHR